MNSLMDLKARNQVKLSAGLIPPGSFEGESVPSPSLLSCGGSWQSAFTACRHITSVFYLHLHVTNPTCVSVCLPLLPRMPIIKFRPLPNPIRPHHLHLQTLFSSMVTFTGPEVQFSSVQSLSRVPKLGFQHIFWQGHKPTHNSPQQQF